MIKEQFVGLRARLELIINTNKIRVLAVTSSVANEGKTFVCANLARQLARSGQKRVLLIDMDIRKKSLSHCLNSKGEPGLTTFLEGSASLQEILRSTDTPGLHFIPGGPFPSILETLLKKEKLGPAFEELKQHFELILVDTPPLIPIADTLSLRGIADGFVLVYRNGHTPYPLLKQAVEELGSNNVLGVVLNGLQREPNRYYKKYYGSYYQKAK